jgi:hypothetical protein
MSCLPERHHADNQNCLRSAESEIPRDAASAANRRLRSSEIQVERCALRVVTHDI